MFCNVAKVSLSPSPTGELPQDSVGVAFVLLIGFCLPFLEVPSNISETAVGGWDFEPKAFPKAAFKGLLG